MDYYLYDRRKKREVSFHEKVDDYIKSMEKEQKVYLDTSFFEDGENKAYWYQKENKKLEEEYKNNSELSEERMKEVADFARIDYYRYERFESRKLSFSQKAKEYKKEVLRLKRHVKESDELKFSNGDFMHYWLPTQNNRAENDKKNGKILTEERKKEMAILNDINHLIESFHVPKRLDFFEKAIEYHTKLYDIGRKIDENDHFLFSDHSKMNGWFERQLVDYRRNSKEFPYKYKKRFPILLMLYTSIESLEAEKDDRYVTRSKR